MYRVLIVEDETNEQRILARHIARFGRESGEQFQIQWLQSAVEFVRSKARFDLVLLDIDLPGINGMEAAQLLRVYDEDTPIIFVTNLAKYAVKGYEVGALDFMLKPVSYPSFALRMEKALAVMRQNAPRMIIAPTSEGHRILPVSRVAFIDVSNHSVVYHLEDGSAVASRGSLSKAEGALKGSSFVRISNSCLINMSMVHTIGAKGLVMTTGDILSFSRSRRRDAVHAITEFWGNL